MGWNIKTLAAKLAKPDTRSADDIEQHLAELAREYMLAGAQVASAECRAALLSAAGKIEGLPAEGQMAVTMKLLRALDSIDLAQAVSGAAPQRLAWTAEDAAAAVKEGWALIDVDSSGRLQAQRDDDSGVLESDGEVWRILREVPSALHSKALDYLKQANPGEWLRIVTNDKGDPREMVIVSAGYSIQELPVGTGWIALFHGETKPQTKAGGLCNYLGVYSSREHLMDDVYRQTVCAILGAEDLEDRDWDRLHIDEQIGLAWSLRGQH